MRDLSALVPAHCVRPGWIIRVSFAPGLGFLCGVGIRYSGFLDGDGVNGCFLSYGCLISKVMENEGGTPLKKIIKRDGSVAGYNRDRIATAILKATASVGTADPVLAGDMALKVENALCAAYGGSHAPTVEDIQDIVENVLMENRLTRIARNYIIYRNQRAMERAARAYRFEITDNVPYRKIYDILRWNMDHGCDSVEDLNSIVRDGGFPGLVKDVDRRLNGEIAGAASLILENADRIRLVIISGPSSSGKTTATIKTGHVLKSGGIGLKAINIDNYFFDLVKHPRDEFGDYDYETTQALDLALINEHLAMLVRGETVRTPHYDFKTGVRSLGVHELKLGEGEILLLDSLHGLYDAMTSSIPAENKFKLYIETLGQVRGQDGNFMRWSDNRLLRRMIRDRDNRNMQPMETLTHWHYVRRSELRHIIPFINRADYIINSALPYELPVLKSRLYDCIVNAAGMYADDPRRLDAHIRANRVCDFLKGLEACGDDACIPGDSLLREFIGGSAYEY